MLGVIFSSLNHVQNKVGDGHESRCQNVPDLDLFEPTCIGAAFPGRSAWQRQAEIARQKHPLKMMKKSLIFLFRF